MKRVTTVKLSLCVTANLVITETDGSTPPPPPSTPIITVTRIDPMAKVADLLITWEPSASTDVTEQRLTVSINGVAGPVQTLPPAQASAPVLNVPASAVVHAAVTAFDGTNESDPGAADFIVPDLEAPVAPTGVVVTITAVHDA